jgi:hypothetical protein
MTPTAKPATNEVMIITSNSGRGDEPTLEFSRDDLCDEVGERGDETRPEHSPARNRRG